MKTQLILFMLFCGVSISSIAQSKVNAGIGYHGENATYPGIVLEAELEKLHTEKFSTPLGVSLGYYFHPRSHGALFAEVHHSIRIYGKGRFYFEQGLGIGVMFSFYPEDVYHMEEDGSIVKVSRWANPDFMPSVTFGGGYRLNQDAENPKYLWIKPKVFWQFPFNNLALPHLALQAGVTINLKSR